MGSSKIATLVVFSSGEIFSNKVKKLETIGRTFIKGYSDIP